MIDVSIIIVTYNSAGCIGDCLDSIARTTVGLAIELFVVDNASTDDTLQILRQRVPPGVVIRNATNAGFPAANNQAIETATGRYVLLLNPDTILADGALASMVAFMDATPACGVCGPVLEDAQGRVAENLRRPSLWLYLTYVTGTKRLLRRQLPAEELEIVSGACLLFRRRLVDEIGALDVNLFWCEDIDFCVRARNRRYTVALVSEARVVHLEGDSARTNLPLVLEKQYTSKIMYLRKHASTFETRMLIVLFLTQLLMRAAKWLLWAAITGRAEARTRARTFVRLIGELPKYFSTAYPRPRGNQSRDADSTSRVCAKCEELPSRRRLL